MVPSDLILDMHPNLSLINLQTTLKNSLLSDDSISILISHLLHKPLPNCEWINFCRHWSHACWLWSEIGLAKLEPIFASSIVPQLPSDLLCKVLLDVWNDIAITWTTDALIIRILSAQVKKLCLSEFEDLVASNLTPRNFKIAMHAATQVEDISKLADSETAYKPYGLTRFDIRASQTPIAPSRPFDFVFTLSPQHDQSFAVVADMRYMYTYWNWFKRLIDVGNGVEKDARTATLPPWTTSNVIIAVLECVHGAPLTALDHDEALLLLEHRREFDLVNAEDEPMQPFEVLFKHCMDLCFPELTDSNRVEHLAKYVRVQMDSKAEEVMDSILSSTSMVDLVKALKLLPIATFARLQAKMQEEVAQ